MKVGWRWLHPRCVASLLAMTVLILCHSEEACRADVGIRPFLRGTKDKGRHAGVVVPYGGRRTKDGVRRRSRFAARRIAGAFVPRPPSSGYSKKGPGLLLGFRRLRRKEVGSFFPAAHPRVVSLAPSGQFTSCTSGKILLTERRVNRAQPLGGWALFAPKRSVTPSRRPSMGWAPRGFLAERAKPFQRFKISMNSSPVMVSFS